MSAGVIILAIVLFLLLAAGIGVGLYFALRKKELKPPTNGEPGNGPSQPSGPVPPGVISGNFSVRSVSDSSQYLSFRGATGNTSLGPFRFGPGNPIVVTSSLDSNTPCSHYSWRNLPVFNYGNPNEPSSALASNITQITVDGNPVQIPPPFIVTEITPNEVRLSQGVLTPRSTDPPYLQDRYRESFIWNYNSTNKTWCGATPRPAPSDVTPNIGVSSSPTNCLYHESSNVVTVKPYNATDTRFQWDLVTPPVTSPNCLSS